MNTPRANDLTLILNELRDLAAMMDAEVRAQVTRHNRIMERMLEIEKVVQLIDAVQEETHAQLSGRLDLLKGEIEELVWRERGRQAGEKIAGTVIAMTNAPASLTISTEKSWPIVGEPVTVTWERGSTRGYTDEEWKAVEQHAEEIGS